MDTIFFDTNAYAKLVHCYREENKFSHISMEDFCAKIAHLGREAGCQHMQHCLVLEELIRQYKFSERSSSDAIRITGALRKVGCTETIFPFEVEYSYRFPKTFQKMEYIHAYAICICYLQKSIDDFFASNNPSQETEIIIAKIAEEIGKIKQNTKLFSQQTQEQAAQLSLDELKMEFENDYMNCIRLALKDEIVDILDKSTFSPALNCISEIAQNLYAWLRDPHINYNEQVKDIPNSFIDALLLASACIGSSGSKRILVTDDKLITHQISKINPETTGILTFEEYLNFIEYQSS